MARAATTADVFNAVAERRRREILDLLTGGERPVNDLAALLGLAQPLVSRHLRVLREVDLVDVRGNGRQRLYQRNAGPLESIYDWVKPYEQAWSQRFGRLDAVLGNSGHWTSSWQRRTRTMTMTNSRRAEVVLPEATQILITREFEAPARLIYRAWTEPELIKRWWSAGRGQVTVAEVDLRVGGAWRYAMVADGGAEVAFHGVYREIVPAERIVSTEVFESIPDAVALNTLTFTEKDGRTTLTLLVQHTSQQNRDRQLEFSDGVQEALDYLERIAISVR